MTTNIYIYIHQDYRVIHKKVGIYIHISPWSFILFNYTISPSGDVSNDLSIVRSTFELLLERHLMSMQPPKPPLGSQPAPRKIEAFPTTVRGSNVGFWLEIWGLHLFSEADSQFFQWIKNHHMKSNYNSYDCNDDRPVSWNALLSGLGWEGWWFRMRTMTGEQLFFSWGFFKCDSQIYPGHVGRTCFTILCKWEPPTINWSLEMESSPQLCRFKFRNTFDLSRHEKVKNCQRCYFFSSSHQNGCLRCFVNPTI